MLVPTKIQIKRVSVISKYTLASLCRVYAMYPNNSIDGTENLQFRNREDMEDTRGLLLDRPVCSFTAGLYTSKLLLV